MFTRLIYLFLKSRGYKKRTLRYKKTKIRVDMADSFAKQMIGLMYREEMGNNEGMLFPLLVGGRTAASVTMLNMKFRIDIVWIDDKHRIVDMARNAQPSSSIFGHTYFPKSKAKYVLELRAGSANKMKIKIGERIAF